MTNSHPSEDDDRIPGITLAPADMRRNELGKEEEHATCLITISQPSLPPGDALVTSLSSAAN